LGEAIHRRLAADAKLTPAEIAEKDARWLIGWIIDFAATEPARYRKAVGGELMLCGVKSIGEDLVIAFRSICGPERRRFLLVTTGEDGQPAFWLQTAEDGKTFPHTGKYMDAATTILAERAHLQRSGAPKSAPAPATTPAAMAA
jgi:hypothetical protein